MKTFEGSYLGDGEKISDDACMECKICHYVYQPEQGDDYWQIAKNTAFTQLPEYWHCPNCDGFMDQFMVIDRGDIL